MNICIRSNKISHKNSRKNIHIHLGTGKKGKGKGIVTTEIATQTYIHEYILPGHRSPIKE